jgi:methylated-DNA-[protein]-cysteine S-methyltransferase
MYNMTFYSVVNSSYGQMLLLSRGEALSAAYFIKQRYCPQIDKSWVKQDDLKIFVDSFMQIEEYFKGIRKNFDIEYIFEGTELQQKVWMALTKLSYGETISYKDIASIIGKPTSIRVVASIIGHNPLIVIVPCHRVIGSDGSLKGYGAGLELKKRFLDIEQSLN